MVGLVLTQPLLYKLSDYLSIKYVLMAKETQIINYHTSGTSIPVPDNLVFGEIAVGHNDSYPRLFIKMNNGEIAEFVDKRYMEQKIQGLIKHYDTVAEYNTDTTRDVPCYSYIEETSKLIYDNGTTIPCTGITLDLENVELAIGETHQIVVTTEPSNTTESVSYQSNDTEIASVSNTGLITHIGGGNTTIIVSCGSVQKEINVSCQEVISCTAINTDTEIIVLGENETKKITINTIPVNTTDTVSVSSLNEDIATVDQNDNVSFVSEGTTTIVITCGEIIRRVAVSCVIEREIVNTIYFNNSNSDTKLDGVSHTNDNPLNIYEGDSKINWMKSITNE